MSASKKKQERKAAAASASEELFSKKQTGKKDKKDSNGKYVVAGIVVAVALVLSLVMLIYQGFVTPNAAAITLGSEKVYAHELNYYYINAYSNFVNQVGTDYAQQLFGLDTTQSLKTQTYYADPTQTWHDYFLETAKTSAQQIHMLADKAKAEGVTLNDEYEEAVKSEMDGLRSYVDENGYSMANYLKAMYGDRMTEVEYERLVRNGYLATQYSAEKSESLSASYTDADLTAYYNENSKDFDMVTYRRYLVSANLTDTMSETERENALTTARDTAAIMASTSSSEVDFIAEVVKNRNLTPTTNDEGEVVEYTGEQAESDTLQSDATYSGFGTSEAGLAQADWLFDSARKLGDVTTVDTTTGTYVLFFISRSRNDYNTVDVRHILVAFSDYDSDGNLLADGETNDEDVTDAQNEAVKARANEILDEWKNGAATEESFGELAKKYTADSNGDKGGLYEQVRQGQMVTNFNDWIFGSGRKSGDTAVISTNYGYHVMYFVGQNDPYWLVQVRSGKASADYEAWSNSLLENYQIKDKGGLANVGLANSR